MKKLFYLAIVLCAIACTNKKSSVNYAKFEPEDGKCLVFIGQDMEAIGGIEGKEGYVNFFGTPAGITIYTNIRPGDVSYGYTYQGLDGLTSNANWGAGNCFADAQLASPLLKGCDVAIGLELVNHEEKVASGEHDSYIIRLGEWIQNIAPPEEYFCASAMNSTGMPGITINRKLTLQLSAVSIPYSIH